jgi:carbonic anhydrase
VHRNIANVIVHSDLNCLSVLQFAIDVLKIRHVIVCGHHGCSGVQAALTGRRIGLADNWLRHVQDVHQKHERYLGDVLSPESRHKPLTIHSWVYGLGDGLLRDLGVTVSQPGDLPPLLAKSLGRYEDGIAAAR